MILLPTDFVILSRKTCFIPLTFNFILFILFKVKQKEINYPFSNFLLHKLSKFGLKMLIEEVFFTLTLSLP